MLLLIEIPQFLMNKKQKTASDHANVYVPEFIAFFSILERDSLSSLFSNPYLTCKR